MTLLAADNIDDSISLSMICQINGALKEIRQELVRVLGILGAVDPFKLMVLQEDDDKKLKAPQLPTK